jgi:type I restriction enzyme, S subunit
MIVNQSENFIVSDSFKENWQTLPIKSLCSKVTSGGTPSRKNPIFYDNGNIIWIKTQELKNWYIDDSQEKITEEALKKSSAKLLPINTVLMAMYGDGKTITSLGILRKKASTNQACCALIPDTNLIEPIYLLYLLKYHKEHFIKLALGGAQRNLSVKIISNFEVTVPPLPTQQKIASILSAYDDLIENNTRRIKILESMAQTLYQEWFVKFRFPGCEQVKMVESELGLIPEGWEVKELGELIDIKHGYAFKSKFYSDEPTSKILLTPGNFAIGGGFQDKKLKYYNGDVPNEFILDSVDLLVTMTDLSKLGDTLGYPAFVPSSKELIYLHNQRLGKILIKEENQIGKQLLYYIFCSDSYRHHVLASATGSTVKHTAPTRIQLFKIARPSIDIRNQFESIANSFYEQITCLNQKNINLRKTRDLLLPKLISGQIDVENLDIDTGDIAA